MIQENIAFKDIVKTRAKLDKMRIVRKFYGSKSLYAFSKLYLAHHFSLPLCRFHEDLFYDLSTLSENKRMVRIAPRGHGKTTIAVTAFVLWLLAYEKRQSIAIVGSNQTHANQKMIEIINEIENNDEILNDFPHLAPLMDKKKQYVKYTDNHVVFKSDAVLIAKGMGSSIRGTKPRPDLIIIDDPEKDTDVESPSTRDKNKRWFDNVVRFLGAPGKQLDIIAIDTLKHFDSLIQYIYDKPGWDSKKYSAIIEDENGNQGSLWDKVYCLSLDDLTDWERQNYAKRGSQGFETIRQPYYGIDHEYGIVGIAEDDKNGFDQEYLGNPVALESMPLREELWKYYLHTDTIHEEMPYRTGALDLSLGKKTSDYQAVSIVGGTDKEYYLLDGVLCKMDILTSGGESSLLDVIINFIKKYELRIFMVEDNGAQALFVKTLAERIEQELVTCFVKPWRSTGDKIARISSSLGLIMQRGDFYVRKDYHEVYDKFMTQFRHFPKGDHDDAPDVTNMCIMGIQRMRS